MKRACLIAALSLAWPGLGAQAGERHAEPLVLNGQLRTCDFTGGVGTGAMDGGYVQGGVYVTGQSGGAFGQTSAFLAAARAHAFAGAAAGAFASAHAFASASAGASGHR